MTDFLSKRALKALMRGNLRQAQMLEDSTERRILLSLITHGKARVGVNRANEYVRQGYATDQTKPEDAERGWRTITSESLEGWL